LLAEPIVEPVKLGIHHSALLGMELTALLGTALTVQDIAEVFAEHPQVGATLQAVFLQVAHPLACISASYYSCNCQTCYPATIRVIRFSVKYCDGDNLLGGWNY